MTKNQRFALIAMLIGMSFALHVLLFEWTTAWDPPGVHHIFSAFSCEFLEPDCLRIYYDATFEGPLLSVFLGIVLPLVMLCGATYMGLGKESSHPKEPHLNLPKTESTDRVE